MKLYKMYLKEKYQREIISDKYGFIVYSMFEGGHCHIHDLYVKEHDRRKGKGLDFERRVIEKEGPTVITCTIDLEANAPEESYKALVDGANYIPTEIKDNFLWLFKELESENEES